MKWISVSEKLPELTIHENEPFIGEWDNSEPVLVYHSDDKWECKYLVAQYTNGFADVGEPILCGWVDVNDGEEVKGVLAWMPLPKPYGDRKTEPTSSKMEQVDEPKTQMKTQNSNLTFEKSDEPQTEEHCNTCRHKDECEGATYEYKNNEWWCLAYAPIDEPQTDCAWK